MSEGRRVAFRFAAAGLGIPVVWVFYQLLTHPSPWSLVNNLLSVIFIIFCPPVLLAIPLIDVEIGTGEFYVLWTLVGLLNGALYAVTGAAYVRSRKKREGSATS